jgi:hypothetical protein
MVKLDDVSLDPTVNTPAEEIEVPLPPPVTVQVTVCAGLAPVPVTLAVNVVERPLNTLTVAGETVTPVIVTFETVTAALVLEVRPGALTVTE